MGSTVCGSTAAASARRSPRNASRITSTCATTGSSTEAVAAADMAAVSQVTAGASALYWVQPMKRTFRSLAFTTAVLTLLLIAWGGIVRATGSGDGCPDWPTCFGRWIPRFEYHTLIEYTHRLLAFLAGLASLALAAVGGWSLIRRGPVERVTAWLAVALLPLFVVQALIGGWIIHSGEDPSVVTLHFAVAFIVLGLVVVIAARASLGAGSGGDRRYARLAVVTAAATYALLLVGTYVRAENAGLAFREWPLMGQSLVPDLSVPGGVAMFAHRMLAIVVVALVTWTMIRARTMAARSPRVVRLSTAALVLLVVQVLVGGANVLTELATWARATHVAISALIWATVVALAVVARAEPAGGGAPSRRAPARRITMRRPRPTTSGRRRSATRSAPTSPSRSPASSCCC